MTFADLDKKAQKLLDKTQDAANRKGQDIGNMFQRVTGQAKERRSRGSTRK